VILIDWHICLQQESCHCHFYGKKFVNCPFEVQTRYSINVPIKINNKKKKENELLSPTKRRRKHFCQKKKKGSKNHHLVE